MQYVMMYLLLTTWESFKLGFKKFLGVFAYKYCSIHGTELESRGFYSDKSYCRDCYEERIANYSSSPYSKES
jgi:hypothetical protein